MRFLIIGAGALGGYYGGMLLKGGADVTFLVRPRRAAQLAERGLIVKNADGELVTGVRTVQAGDIGGPYDVVFLTCKAYDLDKAIDEFLPALAPNGAVLPVLNGINHIAVLQDRLGAGRVLGGVVIFLVTMTPAGEIVVPGHGTGQTSFGELTGERSARCEAIRAALAAGGVASTVSENIVTEMWGKFCGMAASSTVAVVTRSRAGAVPRRQPELRSRPPLSMNALVLRQPRDIRRQRILGKLCSACGANPAPTTAPPCCTTLRMAAQPKVTTSLAIWCAAPTGSGSRCRSCAPRCAICRFVRRAD